MKIVITSQGTEMSSQVDPRFGRAQYFLLFDTDSDELTACVRNEQVNAAQGAGVQAAQNVLNLGAEAVITGNVGPKAFAALQAGGVVICIGASGTVAEALEQFKAGELKAVAEANVKGHWV